MPTSCVGRRLTNAPYGRGDRAVCAGQLKGLVPGTRCVEQGSDDRSDVGAGDRAPRDRRGCAPDSPGGGSIATPPARTRRPSQAPARRAPSAALFALM